MNSLPTLPTDSLYKFMCIGGLALTISSYITISYRSHNLLSDTLALNPEIAITQEKLKQLNNEVISLNYSKSYLETDEILNKAREILDQVDKHQQKIAEYESRQKAQSVLIDEFIAHSKLLKSMIWFGLALSISGFVLWYFKLQRYLDRIVKTKAS